ncbi:phage tail spike protein [Virgibacillus salexigens]|uniref:Tail spike domain-containing protein n=1 Tax=Virgibacillus massiliensis TaxID=1462526 RepID=A0A024QGA3_9BACI|nr:phage tail spike protein [Virgibacillus massiliensis]CDQ41514.1 hypothetical protein BN990_03887 [Virgibacillus massiliensis]
MIHITDGQSDNILDFISIKNIIDNNHRQSLKDNLETFEFVTFADKSFSEYLGKNNRVIVPAEDKGYQEFVIEESGKTHEDSLEAQVFASASYLLLKKAKVIDPQTFAEQTATTLVSHATNGTEWRPGIIEGSGIRTMHIEKHTNPYAFLKRIATEFGLELRFRVETNGNKVTGRYVDLVEQIGQWRGREVKLGKDLLSLKRVEKTDNIFTALKGLGPDRDDGTRLEVIVEDKEALQRWGRPDPITGELQHLWDTYEPQTNDQEMTESRLRELTENELEKRVNEVVEYEGEIADLENVPGMENKKIRFGDTVKIKDTKFNPPLYLEARVHTQERSITDKSKKKVTLGDYIEYTEEEVQSIWESIQEDIKRRLARMLITTVESSAGNTFKNGEGSTELTATVFLSGTEVDKDGTNYTYIWNKYDKRGIPVSSWNKNGKTITVTADEIDEKASFSVDIIQDSLNEVMSIGRITITNVFDGSPGENGQTTYTWVKYADDEGGKGMADSSEGKRYLGLAYNKSTATESNDPADYNWSPLYDNVNVGGRNLYIGSTQADRTITISKFGNSNLVGEIKFSDIELKNGDVVTVSAHFSNIPQGEAVKLRFDWLRDDGTYLIDADSSYFSEAGRHSYTSKVPESNEFTGLQVRVFPQIYTSDYTIEVRNEKLEKGNVATDWTPAPEDVEQDATDKANQAEENAKGHANAVGAAAYQDALNDAQDYMNANGIMQGENYNGVNITNEDGFVTARGDGLVRTVMNSSLGYVIQRRASTSSPWEDMLFFDTNGNAKYAGELQGATGTFSGRLEAQEGFFGDNLRLRDGKLEIVREDGAISMSNGMVRNGLTVVGNDPHFMTSGNAETGAFQSFVPGGTTESTSFHIYGATKGSLDGRGLSGINMEYYDVRDALGALAFQKYHFIHSARYLVFRFRKYSGSKISVHVMEGSSDDTNDRLYFEILENGTSGVEEFQVDLGVPDFKLRTVTFKIGWTHGWGDRMEFVRFIMERVFLTDFL